MLIFEGEVEQHIAGFEPEQKRKKKQAPRESNPATCKVGIKIIPKIAEITDREKTHFRRSAG
jgi:hypothetical protein